MNELKRKSFIYLFIVFGICFGLGFIALFTQTPAGNPVYNFLQKIFTLVPVSAALITRWITKGRESLHISLKVWKHKSIWLLAAVGSGVAIVIGTVLYFMVFPDQYSGQFAYGSMMGLFSDKTSSALTITSPLRFAVVCILLGALFIPLQLLELGEEIGWRGYLLPIQVQMYGIKKAVIWNGLLWGVAHVTLIYFGFNYSLKNAFAPWSNILIMTFLCIVIGIIESYVTIETGNCMYAAIFHGVINLIGEIPVFLSKDMVNSLLGPNPTGLIGMSGLIILSLILFFRLGKIKDNITNES